jgi:hypothetical protein
VKQNIATAAFGGFYSQLAKDALETQLQQRNLQTAGGMRQRREIGQQVKHET